jgi:hypothetical protein
MRESGGDRGSSGRSSRNLDLVRFGTPELIFLDMVDAGMAMGATTG